MKTRSIAGGAAIAFGVLTVVSGGRALFGTADMGAVVPFVLWVNFLAGFVYVIGGTLLAVDHRYAPALAFGILAATIGLFAAFAWWVLAGGAYELRTLGAMIFRTLFWSVMVWLILSGRTR